MKPASTVGIWTDFLCDFLLSQSSSEVDRFGTHQAELDQPQVTRGFEPRSLHLSLTAVNSAPQRELNFLRSSAMTNSLQGQHKPLNHEPLIAFSAQHLSGEGGGLSFSGHVLSFH